MKRTATEQGSTEQAASRRLRLAEDALSPAGPEPILRENAAGEGIL